MPRFAPHGYIRQILPLFRVLEGTSVVESFTNPVAAVANRLVASVAMGNKTYTLANGGVAADGYPHTATLARTLAGTSLDTPGVVTITGLNAAGGTISDVIIPGTSTTTVQGIKAFKSVSSVVGSGWTINPDGTSTADTIVVGFSAKLGLSYACSAAGNIANVYDHTSKAATASTVPTADGTVCGTFFTPTAADGILDFDVVYQPVQSDTLLGTSAATIVTTAALGYEAEVEEFGFTANAALVGATAAQSFTLATANGTIATLALVAAAAGSTTKTATTAIVAAYAPLKDADTLAIARVVSGTAFDSGSGTFYVRLRQRTQKAA